MNKIDKFIKETTRKILKEGSVDENPRPVYSDGVPAHTKYITQVVEEYDLSKGEFPISTLRPITWKGAINEILAIYQSQTYTQEGFERHSLGWWLSWTNDEGNIGRAYAYNLESHRPHEMHREVVKIKKKAVDKKYGELKKIKPINKIENYSNKKVYFDRYFVLGESKNTEHPDRKYFDVQFIETGYKSKIRGDQIGKSRGADPYRRTTYNVGYIGDYKSVKNISESELDVLKDKWENMFRRCYSKKYQHKKNYSNTFIHQDWHSFEQFLKDIKDIPQYHLAKEDGFKGWDLDKDYFGSNCYSKDTCVFLKSKENKLYANSKPFIYEGRIYIRQRDLANEYDLNPLYIGKCIREKHEFKGKEIKFIQPEDGYLYRYELSRNQVNELIKNLKEDPYSRRHMLSFYNWANQDKKMLVECAFQSLITVRNVDGEKCLDWTLIQRSSDFLIAGMGINQIQYVALQMMIAHECGYKVGKFVRFTQNVHLYDRHIEQAHEILKRAPSTKHPKLVLNADGKSFYEITIDDFELIDYEPVKPQLKFDLGI